MVVDASVWLRFLNSTEPHHAATVAWIERIGLAGRSIVVPTIFSTEIAGALVRAGTPSDLLEIIIKEIMESQFVEMHSIERSLASEAVTVVQSTRLKGADAIYVALAVRLNLPLVSWDNEHLTRAASLVDVMTPIQALARFSS